MEGEWYVTVSCAADALGCGRSDIYDLVSRGILEFIQMPSQEIKISTESLDSFFESADMLQSEFH
jgi:excisionase family DNA binding protein